jgi:hypothetical protein
MRLASQITLLATRIGQEVKAVRAITDLSLENCPFNYPGTLAVTVGTGKYPIKGGTYTIISVAAYANSAPTGAAVIIDVNKNDTTIFGTQANRPTIAAGSKAATVGAFSVSSLTDGDFISIDIDQVGSTAAGGDLVVVVRMKRTS